MRFQTDLSLKQIGLCAAIWFFACCVVATCGCMKPMKTGLANPESDQNTTIFWHESYEDALAEAASTGKPILADFTGSDWCVWCTRLKSEVFEKDQFIEWAKDNVVLLELDYPRQSKQSPEIKKQNAELADRFQIDAYPTVLLIAPSGQVIGRIGYIKGGPTAWTGQVESILKTTGGTP